MKFQKSIYQQSNMAMIDAFYSLKQALIRYQQYFGDFDPAKYALWTHEDGVESLVLGVYHSAIQSNTKSNEDKIYMETKCSHNPIIFQSSPSQKIQELHQKHFMKSERQNQIFHSDDDNDCLELESIMGIENCQNQIKLGYNEKCLPLKLKLQQKRQRNNDKSFIRGPYKSYTKKEKVNAVEMFNSRVPITKISKIMGIPCKNIKRWAEQGIQRKKGAGRKRSDPLMQEQLAEWVFENYAKSSDIAMEKIQQQALQFSHDKNFKASRGWLTKFLDRYSIRQHYRVI